MNIKKYKKFIFRRYFFAICAFGILLFFSIFLLYLSKPSFKNVCNSLSTKQNYVCLERQLTEIYNQGGMGEVFKFVDREFIEKNASYAIVHAIFHFLGEYQYVKTHNLVESMTFISPYINKYSQIDTFNISRDSMNGMDGYLHGLIAQYFIDHRRESIPVLVSNVCDEKYSFGHRRWMIPDCYHTIGHAVMASKFNIVKESISACESLIVELKVKGCQKGVYMENAMLYVDEYHRGIPRPDVDGLSMVDLCNKEVGSKSSICFEMVGLSTLLNHENDIEIGFNECSKIRENNVNRNNYKGCIGRVAYWFVGEKFGGDFNSMIRTCKQLDDRVLEICLKNVALGIKLGEAGKKYKQFDFCALLTADIRKECQNNTKF